MTARQGAGRVDVSVAGGTEWGSICLAKKGCRGTFAGLTNPHTLVTRSQQICCMHAGVTAGTQKAGICPAVNGTCSGTTTVTHPWPVVSTAIKNPTVLVFQHWTVFCFFSFSFLLSIFYCTLNTELEQVYCKLMGCCEMWRWRRKKNNSRQLRSGKRIHRSTTSMFLLR